MCESEYIHIRYEPKNRRKHDLIIVIERQFFFQIFSKYCVAHCVCCECTQLLAVACIQSHLFAMLKGGKWSAPHQYCCHGGFVMVFDGAAFSSRSISNFFGVGGRMGTQVLASDGMYGCGTLALKHPVYIIQRYACLCLCVDYLLFLLRSNIIQQFVNTLVKMLR